MCIFFDIFVGDVTLKHLDIKESALDDLDLPIKVISGHLGMFGTPLLL